MNAAIDIKKEFLSKSAERLKKYSELVKSAGKDRKEKEDRENV